ncbi:MAG: DUF2332 domain-containing protein [Burkholderiaceae bacterium]
MSHADDPAALARLFAVFARDHRGDPLYARLATLFAEHPPRFAPLAAAAPVQRKPVLLFAAIHDRLLALREAGQALPALAAYYPSLGGRRAPDEALAPALDAFLADEDGLLRQTVAQQATQTNEVGRSAVLWPALAEIAQRHGGRPLALFDFGCSAGLNLSVDAFRVQYRDADGRDAFAVGATTDPAATALACRLLGAAPPTTAWRLTHRLGADLAPVSLDDPRAVRWLRACLWPSETERAARFEQALRQARAARHPVRAAGDGLALLADWLRGLPAGTTPVLFNSWVLFYFSPADLAAHTARVHALVREHGLVWLSAEDRSSLHATTGLVAPAAPAGADGTPTWWSLSARGPDGGVQHRLLACSHPHGEWLDWHR